MNMHIVRADQRHYSDLGWLKTYWLFSFSDYYDPANIQFGALRVFNDDVVQAGTGFPTHPHRDMEIVTVVLDGEMTHEDSMGNRTVVGTHDVQRMSAGTGVTHSEFNLGDRAVHFYQIWIYPDRQGLVPSYDQASFMPDSWKNRLCPLASGQGIPGTVSFHADATIYRARLEKGRSVSFVTDSSRRCFVYLGEGALRIGGQTLNSQEQARIDPEGELELAAAETCEFILIDVPSCKGWGYDKRILKGASR